MILKTQLIIEDCQQLKSHKLCNDFDLSTPFFTLICNDSREKEHTGKEELRKSHGLEYNLALVGWGP